MHKLMEYICNELETLEGKAGREGALTMAETQYADTLLRMKKNLLKSEEMSEESEYSERAYRNSYEGRNSYERGNSYDGGSSYEGGNSYARGRGRNARRDSRGRYASAYSREGYSRGGEEMAEQIRELMQDAPDEQTRQEMQKFIEKLERR